MYWFWVSVNHLYQVLPRMCRFMYYCQWWSSCDVNVVITHHSHDMPVPNRHKNNVEAVEVARGFLQNSLMIVNHAGRKCTFRGSLVTSAGGHVSKPLCDVRTLSVSYSMVHGQRKLCMEPLKKTQQLLWTHNQSHNVQPHMRSCWTSPLFFSHATYLPPWHMVSKKGKTLMIDMPEKWDLDHSGSRNTRG